MLYQSNYFWLLQPILFYCYSGAMDAVMDTLKDHFSVSIFKNLNPQFWNPSVSWKNKYIDGDPNKGHRKIKVLGITFNYPDALSDAWHICKILREGFNILAVVSALIIPHITFTILGALSFILVAGILRNWSFNLLYNHLLKS